MKSVGVFEAKTQFSALIEAAERGEETVITKRGKPVAKLVPVKPRKPSDGWGVDRGRAWMAPDFDETPPEFEEYM